MYYQKSVDHSGVCALTKKVTKGPVLFLAKKKKQIFVLQLASL